MNFNRFEPFKVLRHYDKLVELSRGNICLPSQLYVYPSNICPFNCGHCIMRNERQNNVMLSHSVMTKLVKDVARLGIKSVIFSGGGEPLTNSSTIYAARQMREFGVEVGMNTNGLLMPESMPVDFLRISIDAGTPQTYCRVKGYDGWDRLNGNLRRLKHNELGFAYLLRPDNYKELPEFCKWAQQYNYTFMHVRPAYWPDKDEEIKKAIESVRETVQQLQQQYRGLEFRTEKFDGFWTERQHTECRSTPLIAVLCADGHFAICQDVFIKFGDYNTQTFEEAWFSESHRQAIKRIELDSCPRCVNNGYNDIIENCIMGDSLKMNIL